MKLLLTSSGITNKLIAEALFGLVGKRPEETSLAFIPTASNVEIGDKGWLIDDLVNLKNLNLKSIDIVDISAVEKSVWQPRLEEADVLFFEGGNSYHLMEWVNKSGLNELMPELLENKVFVGVSAGSMIVSKDLNLDISQKIYQEDLDRTEELNGLSFVGFYVLPHLNSRYFDNVRGNKIRELLVDVSDKYYVLDDASAVVVNGGKVEVVSEGEWFSINI